jgi:hypothetical protein
MVPLTCERTTQTCTCTHAQNPLLLPSAGEHAHVAQQCGERIA